MIEWRDSTLRRADIAPSLGHQYMVGLAPYGEPAGKLPVDSMNAEERCPVADFSIRFIAISQTQAFLTRYYSMSMNRDIST